MSEQEIIKIVEKAWSAVREGFMSIQEFKEEPKLIKSKSYYGGSVIRSFGSEYYLSSCLFSNLNALVVDHEKLRLGTELGLRPNAKKVDLCIWDTNQGRTKPEVLLELKVTGANLFERKNKIGHYIEEIERYAPYFDDPTHYPYFVFVCYFESKTSDLMDKINKYGSLLNWAKKEKGLQISDAYSDRIYEAYMFIGDQENVFIKA